MQRGAIVRLSCTKYMITHDIVPVTVKLPRRLARLAYVAARRVFKADRWQSPGTPRWHVAPQHGAWAMDGGCVLIPQQRWHGTRQPLAWCDGGAVGLSSPCHACPLAARYGRHIGTVAGWQHAGSGTRAPAGLQRSSTPPRGVGGVYLPARKRYPLRPPLSQMTPLTNFALWLPLPQIF